MSLHELQSVMIGELFKHDAESTEVSSHIKQQGVLTPEQRLGIYRHSVQGVLKQSLKAIYPVCTQLMGDGFTDHLVEQLVVDSPPDTAFLPEYGDVLIPRLRSHPALESMRWIADIAALEWARHQAWHSANQDTADFSQLGKLSPEQQLQLIFELPQSACLLESSFAIEEVWLAHQPENKINLECIQIEKQTYLLIWRAGRTLRQVSLSHDQFLFLKSVSQKKNLNELTNSFEDKLPNLLSQAIESQWLISFIAPAS